MPKLIRFVVTLFVARNGRREKAGRDRNSFNMAQREHRNGINGAGKLMCERNYWEQKIDTGMLLVPRPLSAPVGHLQSHARFFFRVT